MKRSILAARKQTVIEAIAGHAERLGAGDVDLVSALRGDSDHRQLQMLERIEVMLAQAGGAAESETAVYTLDEILAVEGLSKTSIKALESALG